MSQLPKVGFIGLGQMGYGSASRLVKAGYPIKVWNRSRGPVDRLLALAAAEGHSETTSAAPTAAAAATDVDYFFSMLANDAAVREIVLQPSEGESVVAALKPGAVHLGMATISVALAKELGEAHATHKAHYASSCVMGRPPLAESGQLNVYLSGDILAPQEDGGKPHPALESLLTLYTHISKRVWQLGTTPEKAAATKIGMNAALIGHIALMGETASLAVGNGVDRATFVEILTSVLFPSPISKPYGDMISSNTYEPPGMSMTLGLKDVHLAQEAGHIGHVPLPLISVVREELIDGIAHGDGGKDWGCVGLVPQRRAGQHE